ncbi:MAG: hypothetical protein FWB80_04755 [Defluviitaleaceae bacterium]|nr:hypothetical protein [Defluviitaleaceae bacterium]
MYTKENSKIEDQYCCNPRRFSAVCVICGDAFKTGNRLAKYCSQRCANDANMAQHRARIAKKRNAVQTCTVCGASIEQGGGKIKIYCSSSCKQKAYRKRAKK